MTTRRGRTAADLDRQRSGSDQATSDSDRMASDSDQALANRDQHASDRDQAAADRDQARHGTAAGTGEAYEESRAERIATARERASTAAARSTLAAARLAASDRRDEVARVRDATAAARDLAAQARDDAADARDRAAETRERLAFEAGHLSEAVTSLRAFRAEGAALRRQAATERIAAAADREAAAADRARAAADRRYADLDELTGVFRRGPGELALAHEIDRSRRAGRPLVAAVVDVDALKAVNDSLGHAAGDDLLRDVPRAITSVLRSYDVVVRWGGDEFVCALSGVSLDVATDRFAEMRRRFAALRPGASISAGLARLADDDTLESLIARADAALYRTRTTTTTSARQEVPVAGQESASA